MTTAVDTAIKYGTGLRARWAPASAAYQGTSFLSWVDPDTGAVRVSTSDDVGTFGAPIDLGGRSRSATAVAADRGGLVVAWVDSDSGEVMLARSRDGASWGRPVGTRLRSAGRPGLTMSGRRLWFAVARAGPGPGGLDVYSSEEDREWRREHSSTAGDSTLVALLVVDGQVNVAWVDGATGELRANEVGSQTPAASRVLHDGPGADPTLLAHADLLYLAWSDPSTGRILVLEHTARAWHDRTVIHERAAGPPALIALPGAGPAVAWIREDGTSTIHIQKPPGRAILESTRVFHGDVVGHPTALSSEHHTPYPYLGIVVLPDDWDLPKGVSASDLTTALDAALDQVAAYWNEASFGSVAITHDVHPAVVTLPSPMGTYFVRARPKLIDGYGAAYPVTFTGSATLDLAADGGFAVTVTLPSSTLTLDDVISAINTAIAAGGYAGAAESRPIATRSDLGQLRIQTASQVDPGDPLAVTGGTALDLLGLGAADRMVYEGSTVQIDHLDLMLRDALASVARTHADPATFLAGYYGCVISIASNIGWYALRANASLGPEDVVALTNEKDLRMAFYYITSLDTDDVHAHEVGHNLGLPDQYEEDPRNVGAEPGLWDGMDGNAFSHPAAWEKSYMSAPKAPAARWIDSAHIATLDSAKQSVEVLLAPLEAPFPAANPFAASHPGTPLCHAIRVDIAGGQAYYIENRQRGPWNDPSFGRVEYSRHLPGDGIVITDTVDDVAALSIGRVPVVMVHPIGLDVADVPPAAVDQIVAATTVAAKQAIIDAYVPAEIPQYVANLVANAPDRDVVERVLREYRDTQIRSFYPVDALGEDVLVHQFPGGEGEIRVKILEVIGSGAPFVYRVGVTWGRAGSWFDLEIRRWQSPPPYDSDDIWIDSAENGWDAYQHSDPAENPTVTGNPVLNGDRPWIGHDNRVMARIWNRGDIPKNNVRVDFREVVPPGVSGGYLFDTDYVDIPAGGSAIAAGTWRPLRMPANEHACIAVQVEYQPWDLDAHVVGEDNRDNNTAQENIGDFYVTKSSPYRTVELPFEFASPLPSACEMKVRAHGLEPGWTLRVEPHRFELQPGERMQGVVVLEAADTVPLEDVEEGRGAPTISLEALVRLGCTWERIGGFSMIAHAVRASDLHVTVDPAGGGAHVAVRATDAAGPITDANVAIAVLREGARTESLVRISTDGDGRGSTFVPIDWGRFGATDSLTVEASLSPKGQSGPCSVTVPLPRR